MTERMTAKQFIAKAKKGTKRVVGAKPMTVDGIKFPSRKEARRYMVLKVREKAKEITNLRRQVRYPLYGRKGPILTPTGMQMVYVADFVYFDWMLDGIEVIEDVKGHQTDISKMKCAIMAAQGDKITLT